MKIIFLLVIVVTILGTGFSVVDGDSMQPTLNHGNVIIYKKSKKNIERFDIIVFKHNNESLIKRVIGLPGDVVNYTDNTLLVNNSIVEEKFQKSITKDFSTCDIVSDCIIPKDKLLVLGDNSLFSHDSRTFGLIDISDVVGKMIIKLW